MSDLNFNTLVNFLWGKPLRTGSTGCNGKNDANTIYLEVRNPDPKANAVTVIMQDSIFKNMYEKDLNSVGKETAIDYLAAKLQEIIKVKSGKVIIKIARNQVQECLARAKRSQPQEDPLAGGKPCEIQSRLSVITEPVFKPVYVNDAFTPESVQTLYATDAQAPTLPEECNYSIDGQQIALKTEKAELAATAESTAEVAAGAEKKDIDPVYLYLSPEEGSTISIAKKGEYDVTLACKNYNAITFKNKLIVKEQRTTSARARRPRRRAVSKTSGTGGASGTPASGKALPSCPPGPAANALRRAGRCK